MESTILEHPPASAPETYESCEQCGSPVEHTQRYCVVCGTRRKHVPDPAARFLASATSKARSASAPGPAAPRRARRSAGLGTALVLAVIPLAVALGLLLGKAGNGADAKLLSALKAEKPSVVNVQSGGGTTAEASTTTTSKHAKGKHSASSGNNAGKVLNKTKYGSFHSVSPTAPPTQAQLNQGAAVVKHDESNTNGAYVNSQKGLPNSIAVP